MNDTPSTRGALMDALNREADAHAYFADNADLRMTTGDHAARAQKIRDIAAALAQPAEAVEGVIEIMRGVVADMALSVPRQSKTVNQELVFAWHERLSNAYQELRRLTTTAGGDNVHDAAQGATWTPERAQRLADDCLQLAKNMEASKHDDAAQRDDAFLRRGLWECFKLAGGDTDGASGPEAIDNADLTIIAVRTVRDLRECYDERAAAPSQEGES